MGLGLAIVRRLARLLDHPLMLASAPGHGARFSVVVPRATALATRGEDLELRPQPRATALRGALVIVVDDDATVVDGMRACLTQWGAAVLGAGNGAQALSLIGNERRYPDLIVADYRLADGELGTTVIARLRAELGLPIPALLVSGDASADAIAAMRASRLQVLLKPVLPDALRAIAERVLTGNETVTPAASVRAA
jgi:CheY-like chemotaxis protein